MNLFSDSVNLEISDIHIIVGPSKANMSNPDDFHSDPKACFYDCEDQLNNIALMHEAVERIRKPFVDKMRQKKIDAKKQRKEDRAKRREAIRKKKEAEDAKRAANPQMYAEEQRKKKEGKEFKQPPLLGLVTRIFRGVKFDIKKIHIRYEDDYFAPNHPFSFGFTIEDIKMDNHEAEEARQRRQE